MPISSYQARAASLPGCLLVRPTAVTSARVFNAYPRLCRARRTSLNTLGSSIVAGKTTSSFLAKSAKAFRIVLPERVRGKPVVNLGGLRLCLKPIQVAVTADPVSVCHQLLSTGTLKVFSIHPFVSRSQCSPAIKIERKDFKEYFLPHSQSGYGIILPGSTPQLAAIIILGFACSMRVHSSLAAKPPNTTECMAPRRAVANIATIASAHPKILRDFPKICDNSPCKWDREHRQVNHLKLQQQLRRRKKRAGKLCYTILLLSLMTIFDELING
uniref:Uncharacterized protein n=1 Tax=Glossina palpalis gambiensis TaxID=67801 RepID=A0A1B0C442_9MUSC